METILNALTLYYGMDWVSMCLGLYGTYLITQKKSHGFLLSSLACLIGLCIACVSHQMGYVAYNLILAAMMGRAFLGSQKSLT